MGQDGIIGLRILVVEDDPSARESLKVLLRIDRHSVTEAADGREALELLTRQTFDLVILDYAMPGMRGNELATSIKRMAPWLPILMVTAFLEKLSSDDKPVDAILGKPYSVDELRREISKLRP